MGKKMSTMQQIPDEDLNDTVKRLQEEVDQKKPLYDRSRALVGTALKVYDQCWLDKTPTHDRTPPEVKPKREGLFQQLLIDCNELLERANKELPVQLPKNVTRNNTPSEIADIVKEVRVAAMERMKDFNFKDIEKELAKAKKQLDKQAPPKEQSGSNETKTGTKKKFGRS